MGAVEIAVTDADRALSFYRDYVGLTPIESAEPELRMGAHGRELVVLQPGAERPVVPRTSGLYHLAIVVPDRRELARVVGRLARLRWDQYPTDHVMTKANYLWDPDGNGRLGIYSRPWQHEGSNRERNSDPATRSTSTSASAATPGTTSSASSVRSASAAS